MARQRGGNSNGISSGMQGTLLGTKSLQGALDALTRQVEQLKSAITKATTSTPGKSSGLSGLTGGSTAGAGRTTVPPTFSGRQSAATAGTAAASGAGAAPAKIPNGGHRMTAAVTSAGATAARVANGGGTAGNGGGGAASLMATVGNGGHAPKAYAAGAMAGSVAVGAARWTGRGLKALGAYGDEKMAGMTIMELAAASAALGQGGTSAQGQKLFNDQTFGPSAAKPSNTVALSQQDAIATALARIRTSGGLSAKGNPRDEAADKAWRSMGMVVGNASYGSTDAAVAAGQIQGPRSQHRALGLGLGSIYDPETRSYIGNAELAQRMMSVATGTSKPTQKNFASSIAQGGKMNYLLSNMGWDPKATEMFTGYTSQLVDLQQKGLDPKRADTLLAQASDESDPEFKNARAELKKYDWQETQFQIDKDTAALDRSGDRAIFDTYILNLKNASKAVEEWTKFVKTFLDDPAVKKVLGAGGAVAKYRDNPGAVVNDAISNPEAFKLSNGRPLGPETGTGLFGQSWTIPSDRGGGSATHVPPGSQTVLSPKEKGDDKAKDKPKAKGSDKRSQPATGSGVGGAIAYAKAQLGKPYLWAATGPNAFDCSGLTMRAYESVGKSMTRTTWTQAKQGNPVSRDKDEWLPGDLIFPNGGAHVVMWLGNNKYIHAPNSKRPVSIDSGTPSNIVGVRRIMGGGASWTGSTNDKNAKGPNVPGAKTKTNGSPDPNNPQDASGTSTDWGSNVLGQASAAGFGSKELDILSGIFAGAGSTGAGWVQGSAAVGDESPGDIDASAGKTGKSSDKKNKGKKSTKPIRGNGGNPAANEALGKQMAAARGWGGKEWPPLDNLWTKESGWRSDAENPSSGAYGIPQANPSGGHPIAKTDRYRNSPSVQIDWGLDYIKGRYGKPSSAWAHSQRTGWYREGAWNIQEDQVATVHQGEMVIPSTEAGTIRDVLSRKDTNSGGGGGTSWTFGPGSIVLHLGSGGSGGASPANARSHAQALFAELETITRNKKIARGM